jgi:hypothetical protein
MCLLAIQHVSITTATAHRPRLALYFTGEIPFAIRANEERSLEFDVGLIQGELATEVKAAFVAPPSFAFPHHNTTPQAADFFIPKAIVAWLDIGNIHSGRRIVDTLRIRAPSSPGEYTLYYRLFCGGFTGEQEPFRVTVTSPDGE